jgi:MoxR-like ATPase
MTYPYFTKGLPIDRASVPAAEIQTLDRSRDDDPAKYFPEPELSHAVNVALTLGMPLLVTGEPGAGKTQLAYAVARELGAEPVLKFETKSTSAARDLFYTFDAMTAFKMRDETDLRQFIAYGALGRAILEAFPSDHPVVAQFLPPTGTAGYEHRGPRRSVVLIDEIDKAPRDFPNDLLNEIERLYFRVPELRNIGTPGADSGKQEIPPNLRPIIVVTSNSEKNLPEPFLRRCVYHNVVFPKDDAMRKIICARFGGFLSGSNFLNDSIDLFYGLRNDGVSARLSRLPGTAEFINWLQILTHRGVRAGDSLKAMKPLLKETLSTLGKTREDRDAIASFIDRKWPD